ncbi:MAG: stage III sporulation protein AB [Oscillibacter sp.]|jgi:stage III sporulation protein AB|nr:stage III sporulation protein AB [Oscillibacter sp.]
MLKILGGACILAAAGAVRTMQVRSLRREISILYGLAAGLEEMENEIRVNRTPLPRLLKKAGFDRGRDVDAFFKTGANALKNGDTFLPAWDCAVDELPVARKEKSILHETGRSLCGDEQQACQGLTLAYQSLRHTLQEKQRAGRDFEKRVTALCFSGAALLIILLM